MLILDQYGRVKYHIANRLEDAERQLSRAQYMVDTGQIGAPAAPDRLRFAVLHQQRMGA